MKKLSVFIMAAALAGVFELAATKSDAITVNHKTAIGSANGIKAVTDTIPGKKKKKSPIEPAPMPNPTPAPNPTPTPNPNPNPPVNPTPTSPSPNAPTRADSDPRTAIVVATDTS